MDEAAFNELSGRIEALGRYVLALTETLEKREIIDGPLFSRSLRQMAEGLRFEQGNLEQARRYLFQAADVLDIARKNRPRPDGPGAD